MKNKKIESLRKEIDKIDKEMVDLFLKRQEVAAEIGKEKEKSGLNILDEGREKEKLKVIKKLSGNNESVLSLFKHIMNLSKERQREIKADKKFALIGANLKYSFSRDIHNLFHDYHYEYIEIAEDKLRDVVLSKEYTGFNITIPYKQKVMELCTDLDKSVDYAGCVNTIIKKSGKRVGYNTDYYGFIKTLQNNKVNLKNKKVLILGSGAMSKMIQRIVGEQTKDIVVASRKGKVGFNEYKSFKDANIVINTTPVGTYPNNDDCLISLDDFNKLETVIDLIYNPLLSKLLMLAKEKNAKAISGFEMLVYQAQKACEIFLGKEIKEEVARSVLFTLYNQKQNIVLIGMPGVGKTTMAKYLSKVLNREYVDTDEIIEQRYGFIDQIFKKEKERGFRDKEEEVIKDVSKMTNKIISLGGGAVERDINYQRIKQNGYIILLERNLDELCTENRPLIKDKKKDILALYNKRKDKYKRWADATFHI